VDLINDIPKLIAILQSDDLEIELDEVVDILYELYATKRYNDYIKVLIVFHLIAIYKYKPFKTVIDLLAKALEFVEKSTFDNYTMTTRINSILAVACDSKQFFIKALNFNFLNLLLSTGKNQSIFLHNIASALFQIKEYKPASKYFDLSLLELEKYKESLPIDKYYYYFNFFTINWCTCNLKQKRLSAVKQRFEKIMDLDTYSPALKNMYNRLEVFIKIETVDSFYAILNETKRYKAELIKDNELQYLYSVNSHLLDNFEISDKDIKIEMAKENFHALKKVGNFKILKKEILKLIEFAEEENNEEMRSVFLEELLLAEKKDVHEDIDGILSQIFLSQYSQYFEGLRETNNTMKLQRDELQELTYILSHDLKTPLRTINSFSSLIEKDLNSKNYRRLDGHLEMIKGSSKNLFNLISNLNDLNALTNKKDLKKEVDLNIVLKELVNNFYASIKNKNVKIKVDDRFPIVFANSSDFQLIFQNLIENAIKFNTSKEPQISISHNKSKEDLFEIRIKDNGIGIGKLYQGQIFSFFKKLHNKTKFEGTGFGLGMVKKIVNSYDGKISVESKVGEGATFVLSFPTSIICQKSVAAKPNA